MFVITNLSQICFMCMVSVFGKFHLLIFIISVYKILPNLQRYVVSFGAMFLILFYDTRMWFLCCSQSNAKTSFQSYSVPVVRCQYLKLPNMNWNHRYDWNPRPPLAKRFTKDIQFSCHKWCLPPPDTHTHYK
jgi:hypothetical protein